MFGHSITPGQGPAIGFVAAHSLFAGASAALAMAEVNAPIKQPPRDYGARYPMFLKPTASLVPCWTRSSEQKGVGNGFRLSAVNAGLLSPIPPL